MSSPPIFAPWLLTGELKPKKVDPVRRRLLDAFAGRPFPLHLNVLWNVLYWNWLPESRCYEHLTDTNLIERRDARTIEQALPVGAFVALERGQKLLWGEVVYKERIIPALKPDICPWEVEEQSLDPELTSDCVDERLVLDFETSLIHEQRGTVDREMQRKRLLDEYGHLKLCARYHSGDARLDDAAFFVEYLLDRHGPALIREFGHAHLTEEQARGALHHSLQSIRDILATTPGLRSWGDYWFTEAAFRDELEVCEGRDRINEIRKMVVRLPTHHKPVGSHAVTLALREYFGRGGIATREHALLSLTGHVARVCHTNAHLAPVATKTANGYVVCEIARRVDGGVWRSQRLGLGAPPGYLHLPSMEIPFGRPLAGASKERAAELLRDLTCEPAEPQVEFRVQRREFKTALSQADIDEERLRLGPAIELFDGQPVSFKLLVPKTYDQIGAALAARVDQERRILTGIDWFSEVYAGLYITGTVHEGAYRLDAYVTPLVEPVHIEGAKEPLRWEFDLTLWHAAVRAARGLPSAIVAKAKSPADLLAAAFQRAGVQLDGSYIASLLDLYLSIVRGGADQPPDLDFAQVLLAELIDSPSVTELPDGRFAYSPRVAKGMSGQDPTTLAAWDSGEAGRQMRAAVYTAETWVQPFYIRKYPYRNRESWERARASFKEAAGRDHAYRYMHMELPEGYSYTRANVHHRRKSRT